jgi:Putative transposase of IS4/5 family (DUF4096)
MKDSLFWLTDVQLERLNPFFPKSRGKPRMDDLRVLSGMIFINRNGLRWRDAPRAMALPRPFVTVGSGGVLGDFRQDDRGPCLRGRRAEDHHDRCEQACATGSMMPAQGREGTSRGCERAGEKGGPTSGSLRLRPRSST